MFKRDEDDEIPLEARVFRGRAKMSAVITDEAQKGALEVMAKMKQNRKKPTKGKHKKKAVISSETAGPSGLNIDFDIDDVELSPATKRRLKKQEMERKMDLLHEEEENQRLFAEIEENENKLVLRPREVHHSSDSDDSNRMLILSVTCITEVFRMKAVCSEKFALIYARVAQHFNLKACEFLLSYNDRLISVDETPSTLNIGLHGVLECIPFKINFKNYDISLNNNCITLRFQASDSRGRKIDLLVHKLEEMKDIMQRYSEIREMPINLLTFEFDGEVIQETDTPYDLEMEHESCIDVIYIDPSKKKEEEVENVSHFDSDTDPDAFDTVSNSDSNIITLSNSDSNIITLSDSD